MVAVFIPLALLAAVGYAAGNILDKLVMTGYIQNPVVKAFWFGIFAPFTGMLAFLLGPVAVPSTRVIAGAFVAGAALLASTALFMYAMRRGEVSRLALILQTNPLFALVLSFLLLGELLSLAQYAGVGTLLVASLLASLDHPEQGLPSFQFNLPFWSTVAAAALFATSAVTLKYLIQFTNFATAFYWQQLGMFAVAPLLLLHTGVREEARSVVSANRAVFLLAAASLSYAAANVSFTAALNYISAAIVSAVVTINPLFVLVLVILLQAAGFDQFEEHTTPQEIAVKTVATVIFVIGIYLVN
ncbi:MAG: EamA family transporter [Candidatus Nanohaloarchaea archaeon]